MLLSKKELERMIGEALGTACPEKAAAAAIHKQMQKGVVWEGIGTWHADGHLVCWDGKGLGSLSWTSEDGPRVRVTVTEE